MYDEEIITELIHEAADMIMQSSRPSAFTGAGMSQESDIPTYRQGSDSIWDIYDIDEVATAFALHINPQKVWDFTELQRQQVQIAHPNAGHNALAEIEERYVSGLPVITQNVDDLHERAGSRHVIHLHGEVMRNRCSKYCQGMPSLIHNDKLIRDTDGLVPRCPHCGEFVRPDVILFGEYLHAYPMDAANSIIQQTDLMVIIGASGLVAPASKIPLRAQDNQAKLIEINPQISRITPNVDVYIPLTSADAIPRILNRLSQIQS